MEKEKTKQRKYSYYSIALKPNTTRRLKMLWLKLDKKMEVKSYDEFMNKLLDYVVDKLKEDN